MPLAPYWTGKAYIIKDTSEEYDPSKVSTDYSTESLAWEDIYRDRLVRGEAVSDAIRTFYKSQYNIHDNYLYEKDRKKPYIAENHEAALKMRDEMVEKKAKSLERSAKKLKELLEKHVRRA